MSLYSVVISGGEKPHYNLVKDIIKNANQIICADSGFDYAKKNNIKVDLVIGDMDSISSDYLTTNNRIYPKDKDFSDTNLALKYLSDSREETIYLIGGSGGRLDHYLSNIYDFKNFKKLVKWWSSKEIIYKLTANKKLTLKLKKNATLSIFPITQTATLSTSGLKWNLNNMKINNKFQSLSNIALEQSVEINCHKGSVMILIPYFV